MMKKILLVLVMIVMISNVRVGAQNIGTTHFMHLNPYSTYSNPAVTAPFNAYFGFPVLGNFGVTLHNTSLHYNDIFNTENNKPVSINGNGFVNGLDENNNWLNAEVDLFLLDFGFRVKNLFFTVDWRLRIDENFRFSKDVFGLPVLGNMQYVGEENAADMHLALNLNGYTEVGLGIQADVGEHFSLGVRPKLLFGLANVNIQNLNARVYTNENDYTVKLRYGIDAALSSPVPISFEDSTFKPEIGPVDVEQMIKSISYNPGGAIDLGIDCRINEHFGLSAAVLDLGFISWKANPAHLTGAVDSAGRYYESGDFVFDGMTMEDIETIKADPKAYLQELLSYFPIEKNLPINIFLCCHHVFCWKVIVILEKVIA